MALTTVLSDYFANRSKSKMIDMLEQASRAKDPALITKIFKKIDDLDPEKRLALLSDDCVVKELRQLQRDIVSCTPAPNNWEELRDAPKRWIKDFSLEQRHSVFKTCGSVADFFLDGWRDRENLILWLEEMKNENVSNVLNSRSYNREDECISAALARGGGDGAVMTFIEKMEDQDSMKVLSDFRTLTTLLYNDETSQRFKALFSSYNDEQCAYLLSDCTDDIAEYAVASDRWPGVQDCREKYFSDNDSRGFRLSSSEIYKRTVAATV